jgi:non-lysosomal glucosylceramidase
MLMWFADGRLREYEAFSCDDVDSVHNDYQRHLMYLWLFPSFEANKLDAWSSFAQAPDGHVIESLAGGCGGARPGALDAPVGRLMGDTTTLFVVEVAEWWRNTGDAEAARARYPAVAAALGWLLRNANATALPSYLTTTYDHFGFERHETVAYNAFVYLAALAAGAELADAAGDVAMAAACRAGIARGEPATTALLWNSTRGFYRAWADAPPAAPANAIFTDTLYGAMIAHAHGLGWPTDPARLAAHLAVEWATNADAFGMRVISDPVLEDSIWMNGPPTISYLNLALPARRPLAPAAVDAALEPLRRMVENYRTRLGDLWNLRALTHSETEGDALEHGGPREQGHYGFALTAQFILPLLAGQQTRLDKGALAFAPLFEPPFVLPVLLLGMEATLEANATSWRLAVAFGSLRLPAGGLSAGADVCADAVDLGPGDSVAWARTA